MVVCFSPLPKMNARVLVLVGIMRDGDLSGAVGSLGAGTRSRKQP
jgi:hypothetical protein